MSASRAVTAIELAARIQWDEKKLRRWLRTAWRAGHPLLKSHRHNDPWVFTTDEADQLRREAVLGPWKADGSSPSRPSTATPTPPKAGAEPETQSDMGSTLSASHVAETLTIGRPVSATWRRPSDREYLQAKNRYALRKDRLSRLHDQDAKSGTSYGDIWPPFVDGLADEAVTHLMSEDVDRYRPTRRGSPRRVGRGPPILAN